MRPDDFSLNSRSELIRRQAAALGFFKTGIALAGLLPQKQQFDAWLQLGMHGEMRYMERQAERRRRPALLLDAVRSIIVVAMNYHTVGHMDDTPLRGKISRYAWGDDYHDFVAGRLRQLRMYVEATFPGTRCQEYVDTGPVMEKVWGAHSALGWSGKHSNLITREQGSWFFIGVILTDLKLQYDEPERDYCGTCTRCISACPTGAIVAPYVVDARLCISYLTIELRGPIPRALRGLIGNRVFGCDDCQEVCPWNRFAVPTAEPSFQPRSGNLLPRLSSLATMTRTQFAERFRGSPVRRAKRDGFLRNVAVALGNSRDQAALSPLALMLRDESALVRAHAAWALGQLGMAEAFAELQQALSRETDRDVLEEIQNSGQARVSGVPPREA